MLTHLTNFIKTTPKVKLAWLVFAFSLFVHLIGLNQIGRTWDEEFKVSLGWAAWDRLLHGDFRITSWEFGIEHPMIAKYAYSLALPPHMILLDNQGRAPVDQLPRIERGNYILSYLTDKVFLIDYNFTLPRLLSAVFNSATVALTFLLAVSFVPPLLALMAPTALLLSPRFVVMGQLITYESLTGFLLMLMVFAYGKKKYLLVNVLTGLLFWTRYNNAYVFILLAGWILIDKTFSKKWLWLPPIVFAIGMLSWPLLWQQFPKYLIATFAQHQSRGVGPSLYFPFQFLITTPIPLLFLLGLGLTKAKKKMWWWFLSVFGFFALLSMETGGTRYIYYVYPIFGILAAIGLKEAVHWKNSLVKKINGKRKKLSQSKLDQVCFRLIVVIVLYQIFQMKKVFPYYLDYYNEFVGGTKGAATQNLEISWWGEGQKEAGDWLRDNAAPQSTISLLVTPRYIFPRIRRDVKLTLFEKNAQPDYLVVSRSNLNELNPETKNNYQDVFQAQVDGVGLVYVFAKK